MPDWQELVRQQLYDLVLDADEKEEVCEELAAHLEESYEIFCKQGLPEKEAAHRTLKQVSDWKDLQGKIFAAKRSGHPMKKRLRQLWVPGFVTLILSMIFLMLLQKNGFQPRIISSGARTILFYVPWLLSLPFFGALGAYLSSRAGGSRGTVLLASVFPVLSLTGAFVLMFPIGVVIELITGSKVDFATVAISLLSNGIGWLLVPGVALLLGGLLAQIVLPRRSISQEAAING